MLSALEYKYMCGCVFSLLSGVGAGFYNQFNFIKIQISLFICIFEVTAKFYLPTILPVTVALFYTALGIVRLFNLAIPSLVECMKWYLIMGLTGICLILVMLSLFFISFLCIFFEKVFIQIFCPF